MNFRQQEDQNGGGFPLAPMVDILFLLLIFFIVTYAYQQMERDMSIALPVSQESAPLEQTTRDIIINITRDGDVFVNRRQVPMNQLRELLKQASEVLDVNSVLIRADKKTFHEYVVNVLDVCAGLNIKKVSFVTIEEEPV
ncbi:MAG: ExbD/TolR family protein [Candidatus Scalinduaceae bacterium]